MGRIWGFVSPTVSVMIQYCFHSVNSALQAGGLSHSLTSKKGLQEISSGRWVCKGVCALLKPRSLECDFPGRRLQEGSPQSEWGLPGHRETLHSGHMAGADCHLMTSHLTTFPPLPLAA